MKFKLVVFALVVTVLISCKKSSDDPAPSSNDGSSSSYRPTKIFEHGVEDSTAYIYSYTTDGKLKTIVVQDSASSGRRTINLTYNASGFINYYSEIRGNGQDYAYMFEYNEDNLVKTKKYYTDPNGANVLNYTITYYYNSNKDLAYSITLHGIGVGTDSTVFGSYVNNRPAIKRSFSKSTGAYSLVQKTRYTYDARMNQLKEEQTTNGGDTTVFYTKQLNEYQILDAKHQLIYSDLRYDYTYLYNNNPSLLSKDKDVDAISSTTYSSSCGASSKFNSVTVNENSAGYLLKETLTIQLFNCGVLSETLNNTVVYEYEQL